MPINYALNPVKWGGGSVERKEGRERGREKKISFLEGRPVPFIIAPVARRLVESIGRGPFSEEKEE